MTVGQDGDDTTGTGSGTDEDADEDLDDLLLAEIDAVNQVSTPLPCHHLRGFLQHGTQHRFWGLKMMNAFPMQDTQAAAASSQGAQPPVLDMSAEEAWPGMDEDGAVPAPIRFSSAVDVAAQAAAEPSAAAKKLSKLQKKRAQIEKESAIRKRVSSAHPLAKYILAWIFTPNVRGLDIPLHKSEGTPTEGFIQFVLTLLCAAGAGRAEW